MKKSFITWGQVWVVMCIHVIFSSSQIGRFGISKREIGVSDREIFAR